MIILLNIFIILLMLFLLFMGSNLEINIKKFEIEITNKINYGDILIYIKLKIFNKITFLKIKIDNKKIEKIKNSKIKNTKLLSKINFLKKEIVKSNKLEILKQLDFNLEQIDLKVIIGLIDIMPTILVIPILSTIVAMIIEKTTKRYKKEKYKYSIIPNYNMNLMVKIKLNCIITIKIVHIIKVIYMMLKKGSEKNDERTSNRRAYVCSNDKYTRYGRC